MVACQGRCGERRRTGEQLRRVPLRCHLEQLFLPVADMQLAYPHFPNAAVGRYGTRRTDRSLRPCCVVRVRLLSTDVYGDFVTRAIN